jgi:hypothetical protein
VNGAEATLYCPSSSAYSADEAVAFQQIRQQPIGPVDCSRESQKDGGGQQLFCLSFSSNI